MIGHELTNTNESTTVAKAKKFHELNTPFELEAPGIQSFFFEKFGGERPHLFIS
jgi:hypothetical protein